MSMEIMNSYNGYMAQNATDNAKKKDVQNTSEKLAETTAKSTESSKSDGTADYAKKLQKLVPSVEFKVGNAVSSARSGKSLTVNPQLLKKMQNEYVKLTQQLRIPTKNIEKVYETGKLVPVKVN